MLYERKKTIFHDKHFKLTENNTLNNDFWEKNFLTGTIFSITLPFSILKVKFSMAEIIKVVFIHEN